MDGSDVAKLSSPWLRLPLTALDWWIAWGKLPARVPMKLGPHGQVTSWATREQAMSFDLWLLAGVLALVTVILFTSALAAPERAGKMLALGAVAPAIVFVLLNGVLWVYQVP
jgi:hypothetical protein